MCHIEEVLISLTVYNAFIHRYLFLIKLKNIWSKMMIMFLSVCDICLDSSGSCADAYVLWGMMIYFLSFRLIQR